MGIFSVSLELNKNIVYSCGWNKELCLQSLLFEVVVIVQCIFHRHKHSSFSSFFGLWFLFRPKKERVCWPQLTVIPIRILNSKMNQSMVSQLINGL